MRDHLRFGLVFALLIAAGVVCLFLAFAPTAHTPGPDQMTGQVRINEVIPVPHTPTFSQEATNA